MVPNAGWHGAAGDGYTRGRGALPSYRRRQSCDETCEQFIFYLTEEERGVMMHQTAHLR